MAPASIAPLSADPEVVVVNDGLINTALFQVYEAESVQAPAVPAFLAVRLMGPPEADAFAQVPPEIAVANRPAMVAALASAALVVEWPVPPRVTVTVPVSGVLEAFWPPVKLAVLAVVGARLGPESVIVQPTPAQLTTVKSVDEGTQLLPMDVVMV